MNLKTIRKQKQLTQTEVAKLLNIDYTTLGRYENGITEPTIETLIKLANLYHTTIDNLIGFEVPYLLDTSTLSYIQKEVLNDIKTLSDENCKRVKDFITGLLIAEQEKQDTINKFKNKNI